MRLALMIPAMLVVASSSLVASAQSRAAHFVARPDVSERPRFERPRVERPQIERHVVRAEIFRARGEIVDGGRGVSASRQGAFRQAEPSRQMIRDHIQSRVAPRGEVDRVRGSDRGQTSGRTAPGASERPGQAGRFRVVPPVQAAQSRVRCAEGDAACGTVAREAPIRAPQATGGAATLMKAAAPIATLRDRFAAAAKVMAGPTNNRLALVCATRGAEACGKLSPRRAEPWGRTARPAR